MTNYVGSSGFGPPTSAIAELGLSVVIILHMTAARVPWASCGRRRGACGSSSSSLEYRAHLAGPLQGGWR